MKLLRGLFFLFFISASLVQAQSIFQDAPTGDSITTTFTGRPAILVEKSKEELPQVNHAEKLPPPKWNTDVQIPIITPFGHKHTASFVNHITDFVAFVTLIGSQSIQLTETIQFINTDSDKTFQYLLPENAEFLKAYHGKEKVNPTIQNKTLIFNSPLSKGVEQFTLSYLLHYPGEKARTLENLIIPITMADIPMVTERFSVILELPKKMTLEANELVFGQNHQKIPEQFIMKTGKENVIYQMTHPLPAFSEVSLHLEFNAKDLSPMEADRTHFFIAFIYTFIMLCYTSLSILVARHKKWKKILTHALKIDTAFWKAEMNKSQRINHYIWAYFKFNWTYLIEVSILILVCHFMVQEYGFSLSLPYQFYMIAISVLSLILISQYGTKYSLENLKKSFYTFLMTTPQGLNLPKRILKSCYQLAICLGFAEAWKERVIQNNPSYTAYFNEEPK